MTVSAEIDETVLREVYLVPFEAVVRGGGRAVMTAYNRLNGTFCSEHPWLLNDVLRGEWGFDGLVMSDWFGSHSAAASLSAGVDLEMPGPPLQRGEHLLAAVTAGEVSLDDVDRSAGRVLALGDWLGVSAAQPATERAGGDEAVRDVIRRAGAAAMVLLRNDGLLPLTGRPRLALIGPYAERGRIQGGGSARVRPEPRPGPLDALRARGFDVTFEPGGWIAKRLPAVTGDFLVEYSDDAGHASTEAAGELSWYWDRPPSPDDGPSPFRGPDFAARITGPFVPDSGGSWDVGACAVGPVTVRLDGDVVVDIPPGRTGGAFFGLGSAEVRTRVELEAGRRYQLEVDYPQHPDLLVRGLAVGARAIPAGDPVEQAAAAAAAADVAVVVVGTDDDWETEGEDRTSLALPGDQDRLVAAVVAANPRTVVVVNAGSPVTMPWLDTVAAVLHVWFPGQELGGALVDVLTGAAEPGGRLPVTFPRDLAATPVAGWYPGGDGSLVYGEGAARRAPLVRPQRRGAAVPVRLRPRLHVVRPDPPGRDGWPGRRRRRHRRRRQHRLARRFRGRAGVRGPARRRSGPAAAGAGRLRQGPPRSRYVPNRSTSRSIGGRSAAGATGAGPSPPASTASGSDGRRADLVAAGSVVAAP